MNRRSVTSALLCLSLLIAVGCPGEVDNEGEPHESQLAIFEKLQAVDANVTLNDGGMIVGVEFEEESQGDEVVELLKGISTLKRVGLAGSAVTDAGLAHLHGLTGLVYVSLEETSVSRAAVQKLRQALPECYVDHGDDGQ